MVRRQFFNCSVEPHNAELGASHLMGQPREAFHQTPFGFALHSADVANSSIPLPPISSNCFKPKENLQKLNKMASK
jgi:hypothetical protein